MTEQCPVASLNELPHRVFHLDRIGLFSPLPTPDQPAEMSIDGNAGGAECVAEDHIGGLAPDAGQGDQLIQGRGHLTVESLDKLSPQPDQRVGLVAVEAGGPDELFEFGTICSGIVGGTAEARKQGRRRDVDALVGALSRQDGRHRQLERGGEVQFAVGVRKRLSQRPIHPAGTSNQTESGFLIPLRRPRPGYPAIAHGAQGTDVVAPTADRPVAIRDPDETSPRLTSRLCPGWWRRVSRGC